MELLSEFQARYPGFYKASHLRTQRLRVQVWRRQAIQRLTSKCETILKTWAPERQRDDHDKLKPGFSAAFGVRPSFVLRFQGTLETT